MLETQRKVESVGKTIAKETPKVQTEEPAVGGRTSSTLKRNRYVLYYTELYCTVLYYAILTVLYYTILYYTILYYTILRYTKLYCTISYSYMIPHVTINNSPTQYN